MQQAHEKVIAEVESMIAAGTIGVGDRLEGERSFAERLGVSRGSVREAIRMLSALGIVRSASGSGPSAGAHLVAEPTPALGALLRLHVAAQTFSPGDVLSARVMIETTAYRTLTAPAHDLDLAHDLLDRMDRTAAPEEFLELDAELHHCLVRVADHPLLSVFMSGLRTSIAEYTRAAAERVEDWETLRADLCSEHRDLVRAVAAGDGPLAARVAEQHVWAYARRTGLLAPL